jgi:amidohydrolase
MELHDEMIALRRDFHANPELGLQEFRTADIIERYLTNLGLRVRRCTETGVIGVLEGEGPGKTVMLRCDIDALPVEEETNLAFSSKNKGVMHACGHDGHTAMLLIAAKVLVKIRKKLNGTIVFLFQTNEEEAGAELMIEAGALTNPAPDAVCGLHLWTPIKTGKIGIVSGPIMASSYYFTMNIYGQGGHGGAPHKAINPIDAAGHVLSAIRTLHTLEFDSLKPTVISVCKIYGGTKQIIVPEKVTVEGSIRCLHNEDEAVRNRFKELLTQVCSAYRCTCDFEFVCGNTMINNDSKMTALAMEVAEEVVGKGNIQTEDISVMLGDDFSEFSRRIPGVYYFVGTANKEKQTNIEHHNANFNIDEDSLAIGVEMQVNLALRYLSS